MTETQNFPPQTEGQNDVPITSDSELLRRYAEQNDEAAFTEVVRRHLTLVYASAVRMLNGDATLAQDVTQSVFTDLAYKASTLAGYTTLAGWLHTSVRFASAKAVRSEERRRNHEQEASTMNYHPTTDVCWLQLRPLLDDAVGQLSDDERNAVLLRFFELKSHREVGNVLGLNENAARMRVERAVEKLRDYFSQHGVTTTAAMLTTTLSIQAASLTTQSSSMVAAVAGNSLASAALAKALTTAAASKVAMSFAQKALMTLAGTALVTVVALLMMAQSNQSTPSKAAPAAPANAQPATATTMASTQASETNNSQAAESIETLAATSVAIPPVLPAATPAELALPDAQLTGPVADAERHMFVIDGYAATEGTITSFRHVVSAGHSLEMVTLHIWSVVADSGHDIPEAFSDKATMEAKLTKFSPENQEYIKNWVLQHAASDQGTATDSP